MAIKENSFPDFLFRPVDGVGVSFSSLSPKTSLEKEEIELSSADKVGVGVCVGVGLSEEVGILVEVGTGVEVGGWGVGVSVG